MEDNYYCDIKDAVKCCPYGCQGNIAQTAVHDNISWIYCMYCGKLIYAYCTHGVGIVDKRKEHKHDRI